MTGFLFMMSVNILFYYFVSCTGRYLSLCCWFPTLLFCRVQRCPELSQSTPSLVFSKIFTCKSNKLQNAIYVLPVLALSENRVKRENLIQRSCRQHKHQKSLKKSRSVLSDGSVYLNLFWKKKRSQSFDRRIMVIGIQCTLIYILYTQT